MSMMEILALMEREIKFYDETSPTLVQRKCCRSRCFASFPKWTAKTAASNSSFPPLSDNILWKQSMPRLKEDSSILFFAWTSQLCPLLNEAWKHFPGQCSINEHVGNCMTGKQLASCLDTPLHHSSQEIPTQDLQRSDRRALRDHWWLCQALDLFAPCRVCLKTGKAEQERLPHRKKAAKDCDRLVDLSSLQCQF